MGFQCRGVDADFCSTAVQLNLSPLFLISPPYLRCRPNRKRTCSRYVASHLLPFSGPFSRSRSTIEIATQKDRISSSYINTAKSPSGERPCHVDNRCRPRGEGGVRRQALPPPGPLPHPPTHPLGCYAASPCIMQRSLPPTSDLPLPSLHPPALPRVLAAAPPPFPPKLESPFNAVRLGRGRKPRRREALVCFQEPGFCHAKDDDLPGFLTLSLLFSCARRQVGGHGPVVSLHGTSMVAKPIDSKRQECKFYQVSDLGQIC